MEIKILFLDLDGTLLNRKKEISAEDKAALWKCHEKGMKIGFVTSRTDRKITSLTAEVPYDFVCSLNGGHIRIMNGQRVIWEQWNGILWKQGADILRWSLSNHQDMTAANFEPYSCWNGEILKNNVPVGPALENLNSITPSRFQRIRLYNAKEVPFYLQKEKGLSLTLEGDDLLIESLESQKDNAVSQILEYYGFSREEAVAFGDGENDIPMFRMCETSVAMRNSSVYVKTKATYITEDCDHSGVSSWLNRYIIKKIPPHIVSTLGEENGIYLLKDLKGIIEPISAAEKRQLLQNGAAGHEVAARDVAIDEEKNILFQNLVEKNRKRISQYVGILSESILIRKKEMPVLVSLARGGIIYGAACKAYYKKYYQQDVPHFVISLVRDMGIDENALDYIVDNYGDSAIQFIDGWTGSGYLSRQLEKYIDEYNEKKNTKVSSEIAVIADTSHICVLSGTREDIMLPDCCLNATVCGLLSSICVKKECMGPRDFHGAFIWDELIPQDFSRYYLDSVVSVMEKQRGKLEQITENYGQKTGQRLKEERGLAKVSSVRLGIGETTRALFRREMTCILAKDVNDERMEFLLELTAERNIPIVEYDTGEYTCVGILKETSDD